LELYHPSFDKGTIRFARILQKASRNTEQIGKGVRRHGEGKV
jgi:hypothetical protein